MITKFNEIGANKLNITNNSGDILGNLEINSNKLQFSLDGSIFDVPVRSPIQSVSTGELEDFLNLDIGNGGDFKFIGTDGTYTGSDLTFTFNLNNWSGKIVSGMIICYNSTISNVFTRYAVTGAKLINELTTLPIGNGDFDIINYFSDGTYLYVSIANSFG